MLIRGKVVDLEVFLPMPQKSAQSEVGRKSYGPNTETVSSLFPRPFQRIAQPLERLLQPLERFGPFLVTFLHQKFADMLPT